MNDLAVPERTQLPKVYEAAKQALATCAKVDECKDWADKSAAIASYAKQAEDDTLLRHARKIQVRAVKRMGALIDAVDPAKGGDRRSKGGQPPVDSRKALAKSAGLSEHQQKQAQRVARVPDDEFERLVESDDPPTVTQLAELGKEKRARDAIKKAVGDRDPNMVRRAVPISGNLGRLHDSIQGVSPEEIAGGFLDHEIGAATAQARDVSAWLIQLERSLCTQKTT